ncbi:hypothetical protein PC129_g7737 [Phytophthora cactorum]|uniref:Uncharacterized protein n=2 Tax=Phytophthora cactorum TaxID=29920 RepID=A0A8T1BBP3_9STRA|nr:hypothetical protein Pcac1_g13000 [Phytophthora cactorum]KAG2899588.1 hypothetical protein PC115_g16482 [Phytophthora cactorum]KAG2907904.1 hypothetical protein PC114_g10692 [Phytophthora cactorum]KAG3021135.1 hypothetical protein PC120_g8860 [Phytophthora cactorum]KAG3068444.1 hypothetical protein PC121_g10207 [Phytophthora cactorum]
MFKGRFKLRVRDEKGRILQLYEASATTEKAEEEIDLTGEDLVKQRDEDSVVDPQVEGGDTQEMQSGVYADAEEGPSDEYKDDEEQAVAQDRCRCAVYDGREAKVKALHSDMKGAKQQAGLAYSHIGALYVGIEIDGGSSVSTSTSTSTSVPTSTSSKRKAGDRAARSPLLDPDSDASDSLIDRVRDLRDSPPPSKSQIARALGLSNQEGKTEEDDTEDFAVLNTGNDTTIRLTPELRNKLVVLETLQHASED